MTGAEHDRIPETALDWLAAGRRAALATVVETWGSAPRQRGAQLAIADDAEMAGSVSGGCVEGAVVAEALDAIEDGRPRLLTFGVSDDDAFAVGLACGGTIRVMVEPLGIGSGPDRALIEALVAARAARRPAVLATRSADWSRRLVDGPGDALWPEAAAALGADRSGTVETQDGTWFLAVHNPPLRLLVVGAVHIAQALVPMARTLGYDVTVIDPREAFASPARFPLTRLVHDWPDAALAGIGVDGRTAVVALTHDPKLDDPALIAALAAEPFYVGALGSTRTHARRLERLTAAGVAAAAARRIHAPIGAPIGASTPAEIAVAILAEITERLRRPETRPGAVPRSRAEAVA